MKVGLQTRSVELAKLISLHYIEGSHYSGTVSSYKMGETTVRLEKQNMSIPQVYFLKYWKSRGSVLMLFQLCPLHRNGYPKSGIQL